MQHEDHRIFVYHIDAEDRISYANDEWIAFGIENGLTDLSREKVLGKSLWDFISDPSVTRIYKELFEVIKSKKSRPKIPYRCDSPDCRRFMQMELSASEDGVIRIASVVLKLECRPSMLPLEKTAPRSEEVLAVCSACKKVKLRPDHWYEIEDAAAILGITNNGPFPKLSHTLCEKCLDEWNKNIFS